MSDCSGPDCCADRPDDYPEATVSPWHYDAAGHRVAGPAPVDDGLRAALAERELEADEQRLLDAEDKGDSWDPPDPEFDPRDDMHIDCGHDDSDGPAWRERS